jgi:hypothetical protein
MCNSVDVSIFYARIYQSRSRDHTRDQVAINASERAVENAPSQDGGESLRSVLAGSSCRSFQLTSALAIAHADLRLPGGNSGRTMASLAVFLPFGPEDSHFLPRCRHAFPLFSNPGHWQSGELPMKVGGGGLATLIFAVGLFACCTARSEPACAATDIAFVRGSLAQAGGNPMAAPRNPGRAPAENLLVAADQLNEVDRALNQDTPPAPAKAQASRGEPARRVAVVMASSDHSIWRETTPLGKLFVGFGALLTLASAARMFMA